MDRDDITQLDRHGKDDLAYMQSLVASAIVWMNWAEIDVVIRGSGKVIPASQVQVVQSLEGGIVSEILVQEGEAVEVNQPLIKISDIAFASSFEENRIKYLELLARAARLQAEAFGKEFEADPEVEKARLELNRSERGLFESHREQLTETLGILDAQIEQQQSALQEAHSKQRQLRKSLKLVRKEIEIKKPLKQRGIISEVEFLQLQQREAELEGELEAVGISIPRIQSTIDEARSKRQQALLDFRNKAKQELNEIRSEIARIREAQIALRDRVTRTTLRSPVKGIVQRLFTTTVSGVVNPGSPVVEIVPQEDSLLIELRIKPADIASVRIGQTARLKFSAYDFAVHGSLPSKVTFISADTITDEDGNSYYLLRVKPERDYLGHPSRPLPIKVGMTVEADIVTDKKTILQYLMEPVTRGLDRALKEPGCRNVSRN